MRSHDGADPDSAVPHLSQSRPCERKAAGEQRRRAAAAFPVLPRSAASSGCRAATAVHWHHACRCPVAFAVIGPSFPAAALGGVISAPRCKANRERRTSCARITLSSRAHGVSTKSVFGGANFCTTSRNCGSANTTCALRGVELQTAAGDDRRPLRCDVLRFSDACALTRVHHAEAMRANPMRKRPGGELTSLR